MRGIMSLTDQQQLDEIQTAITGILTGAQVTKVDGSHYQPADLGILIKERNRLQSKVDAAAGTGGLPARNVGLKRQY